jgi:Oxidoreductase-like protein, N-terminal
MCMSFPITDQPTALAVIQHVQRLAAAAGQSLRDPPPDPVGCCGRGCNGCVWEGYFEAVAYWRDEALLMLEP